MFSIAFTTLGCKANWADTEELADKLFALGYEIVPFEAKANVYVVNTCAVTSVAEQQARQLLRQIKRREPESLVIACGCFGEIAGCELRKIEGVDAVFGTKDRNGVIDYICARLPLQARDSRVRGNDRLSGGRARAFLKILDGCNRRCAYCVVPMARGKLKSVEPEEVTDKCLKLAKQYKEIVLTGIDIGQYGSDLSNGTDLLDLLERLVSLESMPRLRLSSIDPTMVDNRLVDLMKNSGRICRHIHLSVQSASKKVLEKMGRNYGPGEIIKAVGLLSDNIEDINISADIIAGFPTETDMEHKSIVELLSKLPLAWLHVFPYSERKGTRAAEMAGQVDKKIRKERAAELRNVAFAAKENFLKKLAGKQLEVIVTSRKPDSNDMVNTFSDNACIVQMPAGRVSYGEMGSAVVTEVSNFEVRGVWA